jgi:hypothetical protein
LERQLFHRRNRGSLLIQSKVAAATVKHASFRSAARGLALAFEERHARPLPRERGSLQLTLLHHIILKDN